MKIKTKEMDYDRVVALAAKPHRKPVKQSAVLAKLLRMLSKSELRSVNFKYDTIGMERLGKKEPALFLMNHSCFLDIKASAVMLKGRPYNIVCTSDGFVGKEGLMRRIGCIPTQKFVQDITLIRDMSYIFNTLKSSVLMYPEASYSFDGTATPLPESLGKLIKLFKVPVVMIKTTGAFHHDPLYNNLQLRKVPVHATMKYLLSPKDIASRTVEEINEILAGEFSFDNFKWQKENNILVSEPFRADCLNRVLYKCPACGEEGHMEGRGIYLTCSACGKRYELTENGQMLALDGNTEFSHIPDWYRWERECVRQELLDGTYEFKKLVDIKMLVNMDCVYDIGKGVLEHSTKGWHLRGANGRLDFSVGPLSTYSLYSDYYWYEIGDMICIGDTKTLYYCFPEDTGDIVAKARLATEELYKIKKAAKRGGK
ncbi:MAG: 1-acyl-sn-glycerol-3-phosphate acyltransferase [Lachnospiraceae bacterium]|nr:1-acyl-sn-glycerol-3-phosphate acyltransferase [Lachnospiraceae bacterium]